MIVNPQDPTGINALDQQTAGPIQSVIPSQKIVSDIESTHAALPPEHQAAIGHALGIVSSGNLPVTPTPAPLNEPPAIQLGIVAPPATSATVAPQAPPSTVSPALPSGLINRTGQPIGNTPSVAPPLPGEAELRRLQTTGPGVNQIQNGALRGIAKVGDVIGSIIAPRWAAQIPGTTLHNQLLQSQAAKEATEEQGAAKSAAEVAQQGAATKLTEAQVPHVQAETAALGNPKDEFALFHQQNPAGTVTDFVKQQEAGKNPTSPYQIWHKEPANAGKGYMDFVKEETATKPPSNELELYVKTHPDDPDPLRGYEKEHQDITSKPLTKDLADSLNRNYNALAQQYKGIPLDQFHEGMTSAESTQLKGALLGAIAGTQKGQNITINQNKADNTATSKRDAETGKEFTRVNRRLTTAYDKLQSQMDNLDAADKEIGGAAPAQALGIIKSIVATAGGQGSGVRITQAELNSLTKARSLGDSFEAWMQKFGSGKSLAPEQVTQIRDMLHGIRQTADVKHQMYLDHLDRLNSARSVPEIRAIESEVNHAQSDRSQVTQKLTPGKEDDEYGKLPSGTHFIGPDGKERVKP